MGNGIIVCGLNGAGKSTLGKALGKKLSFYFIDNEDLYFPKNDPNYLYSSPRTHEEAEKLLAAEIQTHGNFVFASVKGDYCKTIISQFHYAIWLHVPKDIRIQRVKKRSFQKFGNRMMPGGDLYEKEKNFFDFVESRPEDTVEKWLKSTHCSVIHVDGTRTTEEMIDMILKQIPGF